MTEKSDARIVFDLGRVAGKLDNSVGEWGDEIGTVQAAAERIIQNSNIEELEEKTAEPEPEPEQSEESGTAEGTEKTDPECPVKGCSKRFAPDGPGLGRHIALTHGFKVSELDVWDNCPYCGKDFSNVASDSVTHHIRREHDVSGITPAMIDLGFILSESGEILEPEEYRTTEEPGKEEKDGDGKPSLEDFPKFKDTPIIQLQPSVIRSTVNAFFEAAIREGQNPDMNTYQLARVVFDQNLSDSQNGEYQKLQRAAKEAISSEYFERDGTLRFRKNPKIKL